MTWINECIARACLTSNQACAWQARELCTWRQGRERETQKDAFPKVGMRLFREKLRDWMMGMALFALIFQALIPAAQAIPLNRNTGGAFDSLIICTAWGAKVLQLTTGEKSPVKETTPEKCPVCSVHAFKLSLGGENVPLPLPPFQGSDVIAPTLEHVAPNKGVIALPIIRGPPVA